MVERREREEEEGVEENVRGTHVYILIPMEGMRVDWSGDWEGVHVCVCVPAV